MPTTDRSIGFAKVLTGFTGSLSVTVGSSTVAITPTEPTSAVELAFRVDQTLAALGAGPYGLRISAAGVFEWSAVSSFTLAASGVIKTRMNLATTASGTSVTSAGAHADGFYPSNGMIVRSPLISTTSPAPIADGSNAPTLRPVPTQTEVLVHANLSEIWGLEHDFDGDQLFDYHSGSSYQGRLRITSAVRVRDGKSHELAHLRLQAQAILDRGPY